MSERREAFAAEVMAAAEREKADGVSEAWRRSVWDGMWVL